MELIEIIGQLDGWAFGFALAFIFLHEQFTVKSLIGCILIGAGTLVMVL